MAPVFLLLLLLPASLPATYEKEKSPVSFVFPWYFLYDIFVPSWWFLVSRWTILFWVVPYLFPLNFNFNALPNILVVTLPLTWPNNYSRFSSNSVNTFWSQIYIPKNSILIPYPLCFYFDTSKDFHSHCLDFVSVSLCMGPRFGIPRHGLHRRQRSSVAAETCLPNAAYKRVA